MSRRRKFLIAAGIVLGVAVLIPVIRHYQLRFAVENYVAELKAKGEPMDLAQVIPPPVPPEQNSAQFFTNAISQLNTNYNVLTSNQPPMMRGVTFGKAMIGWQQSDVCEYPNDPTNSWMEIETALASEQAGLKLLRQLPAEPVFDFDLNYSDGFSNLKLGPLAAAKRAVLKLGASESWGLRRNDTDTGVKDIQAMLSIANGLSHDHLLISELVRIAITSIASGATWEFLQSTNLTDTQLSVLQDSWTNSEFIVPFENSMKIERVVGQTELKSMRDSTLESYFGTMNQLGLFDTDKSWLSTLKIKWNSEMWRYWWSYPDELRQLRGIQAVMEAVRQVQTNYSFFVAETELKAKIKKLAVKSDDEDSFWFADPTKVDFHFIISSSMNAFTAAFDRVMRAEVAKQMTITAIALKRYQLKHGNYPADLNLLVPEFISAVPLDPVDGQPLRYRPNADGTFLLYSVGENGVDDGGDPSLEKNVTSSSYYWQNDHALDWVWPQPATEAEIQAYYKKLSSQKN
jgi:hypothetical protein